MLLHKLNLEKIFIYSPSFLSLETSKNMVEGDFLPPHSSFILPLSPPPPTKKYCNTINTNTTSMENERKKKVAMVGFYKRSLPTPPAIDFTSSEGKVSFSVHPLILILNSFLQLQSFVLVLCEFQVLNFLCQSVLEFRAFFFFFFNLLLCEWELFFTNSVTQTFSPKLLTNGCLLLFLM